MKVISTLLCFLHILLRIIWSRNSILKVNCQAVWSENLFEYSHKPMHFPIPPGCSVCTRHHPPRSIHEDHSPPTPHNQIRIHDDEHKRRIKEANYLCVNQTLWRAFACSVKIRFPGWLLKESHWHFNNAWCYLSPASPRLNFLVAP